MFTIKHPVVRAAAVVTFLGSVAVAAPAFAAPHDDSTQPSPPNTTMDMDTSGDSNTTTTTTTTSTTPATTMHHDHIMKGSSPDEMRAHVEMRIKSLHDKLMITQDEESAWGNVAQAMRDNEAAIGDLIQQRHTNAKNMTAVDDLESYQKIAQAHADGLGKVTSAFETLYSSMSDDQKKNADKVFSSFEGHGHMTKHHHMMKKQ